jgi:hypothetical protein
VNQKFGGNYLNEETLIARARAQGFSTAVIGKLGPTRLVDSTAAADGSQTLVLDDDTGHEGGIGLPAWFTNGLNFAAKLLTAYGLSLLLSMMASKGMMVFFLLGFFGCAHLGLDVTGISIFGVLLALILMSVKYSGNTAAAMAGVDDDYDPLEDDEL